ncbi:hypothetical protein [Ferroplasma sp.]|uniref:hypothetical protein n=1 Tax=Ferroplasma sp. TaxID=2591003 RepID=UPI00307EC8B8
MAVVIESTLKTEKLVKPTNPDASNFYLPVRSLKFSGKLGISNEIEMDGRILKVTGKEDYLNTEDLANLEGTAVRLYLMPAGCGPNDGVFFSRNAYKLLDSYSVMPDKYEIRLEIFSIGEKTVEEDLEIKQQ